MITKKEKEIVELFSRHIGHTITCKGSGVVGPITNGPNISGKLVNVTCDEIGVMLWFEHKPFMKRYYWDQALFCDCGWGQSDEQLSKSQQDQETE
jgi:hypothetical protein